MVISHYLNNLNFAGFCPFGDLGFQFSLWFSEMTSLITSIVLVAHNPNILLLGSTLLLAWQRLLHGNFASPVSDLPAALGELQGALCQGLPPTTGLTRGTFVTAYKTAGLVSSLSFGVQGASWGRGNVPTTCAKPIPLYPMFPFFSSRSWDWVGPVLWNPNLQCSHLLD